MRYIQPGKITRSIANAMRGKRFRPEEMSDYMLRDIGFVDGRPAVSESGLAETDNRSRRIDLITLTPYAS